ncbi:hypothetical protein WFR69_005145 [Escherichia coli]
MLNHAIQISLKPLHFSCRIPATKIKHHENQYDILKSKKFIILLLLLIYHFDKVYPSAGRTNHHEGEALKNLALKKGSIQSRRLWDWMNEQADARPMYKQRSWQAVTNLRLKTASLVVRAL